MNPAANHPHLHHVRVVTDVPEAVGGAHNSVVVPVGNAVPIVHQHGVKVVQNGHGRGCAHEGTQIELKVKINLQR